MVQDEGKQRLKDIDAPEIIRHYIYKSKNTAQYITDYDPMGIYSRSDDMNRLNNIYFILKSRLHSLTRPCKLMYYGGSCENVIAWVRSRDDEIR